MSLIHAGAILLPAILTAFAGYRAGWAGGTIAIVVVAVGGAMAAMAYWGMTT